MTSAGGLWHAAYALLPSGLERDVRFEVADGRFTQVTSGSGPGGAERLPGVVLPGLANCHSHAFHRALRGRTHDQSSGGGTFWTWREQMYAVAAQLNPDRYLALARAAYAEMALAGITTVGEFHYLHHGARGVPYDDPNVMAEALRQAAADAGVRLTLLDACYLHGGLDGAGHTGLDEVQRRFSDGSVDRWRSRVGLLAASEGMRVGVAIHSVRAVDRAAAQVVAATAGSSSVDCPLHVHLSEQLPENVACQAFYGRTPTELLDEIGALTASATAVHATHLTPADRTRLGMAGVNACLCPTTERDLGDGIGPARALADAGARLSVGSDQQAVIDLFEEVRGVEMHERLTSLQRARFTPAELLGMATAHHSLGWPDAGRLEIGARADLVAVRLDSARTAGCDPAQVLLAAGAADIDTVVVDGRVVVSAGRHLLGDAGAMLAAAIAPLWEQV